MTSVKPVEDETRTSSFGGLLSDAVSNTGMQGLPNMHRAKNCCRKTAWLFICLAGVTIMVWQIALAVIKYYEYPTQTTVEYTYKTSLDFPAITICNNNPIDKNRLENNTEANHILKFLESYNEQWEQQYGGNASKPTEFDDWHDSGSQTGTNNAEEDEEDNEEKHDYEDFDTADDVMYQGEEDESFDFVEDIIALTSNLPRSVKTQIGHQLDNMIINCQYQGKKCQSSQFHTFNNYLYGNCFTFNSGRNADLSQTSILKTSKIGPLYGFSLELYIEQDEYIEGLADAAGIRLLIQNQTYMPFPEDYGISLMPGTKTSIGIVRKDTYRADHPHGTCETYTEQQNKEKNAFLGDVSYINYTTAACRKTCFQKALLVNCSCFDYVVPTDGDLEAFKDIKDDVDIENLSPCYDDDVFSEKESCIKEMTSAFLNNTLGCADTCHVPCYEVEYPYRVSYSQWPSLASERRVLDTLARKSEELWDLVEGTTYDDVWKKQWMNNNFLKLEVYFTSLNYEVVKTSPSYDAIALISDLGGQAGLWLGVSVIAFFELFELVADVIILLIKWCKDRSIRKQQEKAEKKAEDGPFIGQDEMLPSKPTHDAFTAFPRKNTGSSHSRVKPTNIALSDV